MFKYTNFSKNGQVPDQKWIGEDKYTYTQKN